MGKILIPKSATGREYSLYYFCQHEGKNYKCLLKHQNCDKITFKQCPNFYLRNFEGVNILRTKYKNGNLQFITNTSRFRILNEFQLYKAYFGCGTFLFIPNQPFDRTIPGSIKQHIHQISVAFKSKQYTGGFVSAFKTNVDLSDCKSVYPSVYIPQLVTDNLDKVVKEHVACHPSKPASNNPITE